MIKDKQISAAGDVAELANAQGESLRRLVSRGPRAPEAPGGLAGSTPASPAAAGIRTAWRDTKGDIAIICATCPDREFAEARATAAGLQLSHGICPECLREQYGDKMADRILAMCEAAESAPPPKIFVMADREIGAGKAQGEEERS